MSKLINGNAIEIMKTLKDESVDLVVTDPPYKLNKTSGSKTSSSKSDKWQGNLISGDKNANILNNTKFSEWLPLVYKCLKTNSHFLCFCE